MAQEQQHTSLFGGNSSNSPSNSTGRSHGGAMLSRNLSEGTSPSTPVSPMDKAKDATTSMTPHNQSSRPNTSEEIIDPDGDLYLEVGTNIHGWSSSDNDRHGTPRKAVIFRVDSRALARSIKFFKSMLYGNFIESQKPDPATGKKWCVCLPDDNPSAMRILLNIMHSNFDKISRRLEHFGMVELVYDLAILADKYDCVQLFHPWANYWMRRVAVRQMTPLVADEHLQIPQSFLASNRRWYDFEYQPERSLYPPYSTTKIERLAWIYWVFGCAPLFDWAFFKLVCFSGIMKVRKFPQQRLGSTFSHTMEPPGLKEMISPQRDRIISDLVRPIIESESLLHTPNPRKDDGSSFCVDGDGSDDRCREKMLSSLTRALIHAGLASLFNGEPWEYAIEILAIKLYKLPDSWESPSGESPLVDIGDEHSKCCPIPGLKEHVVRIMEKESRWSVMDTDKGRHFTACLAKSGVSADYYTQTGWEPVGVDVTASNASGT